MKSEDKVISANFPMLNDIKDNLNTIFENQCLNVLFTLNTDKSLFGVRVNPNMTSADALTIIATDERVSLDKYQLELDSKIFELGLDVEEITAIILYEISSIVGNYEIIDNVRATLDYKLMKEDDVINIRDSVNYAQLIIFAIKDTINKLGSFFYKEEEVQFTSNQMIIEADYIDTILSAKNKIAASSNSDFMRSNKPIILDWMLILYRNMTTNSKVIVDTLKDAKAFTASKLEIAEIDKTITAVDRIDSNIAYSESSNNISLTKFIDNNNMSIVNEISIFKSIRKSGLRGIENDLYEFTMRVKACTTEDDALIIMRGINSRLGILEDYIANEDLVESEYNHLMSVINSYREIRYQLAQKKFKEKSYGLFYRYDQLDDPV